MKYTKEHEGKEICLYTEYESKCLVCNEPTHAIDWSEARICSTECMEKFGEWILEHERLSEFWEG